MKTLILTIPFTLPGLNEVNQANRTNRYKGAALKRDIDAQLQLLFRNQCDECFKRIKISFKWYESHKRRDFDNICSAKKFILDALVKSEIIPNDGWKNLEPIFLDQFYHDKENPRIEITIEGK